MLSCYSVQVQCILLLRLNNSILVRCALKTHLFVDRLLRGVATRRNVSVRMVELFLFLYTVNVYVYWTCIICVVNGVKICLKFFCETLRAVESGGGASRF